MKTKKNKKKKQITKYFIKMGFRLNLYYKLSNIYLILRIIMIIACL